MDEVAAEWPHLNKLSFLKCDAEGFDIRVLHGAEGLLTKQQPVVLFEYNRNAMDACGEEGLRAFDLLRRLGYERLFFYDAFGRLLLTTSVGETELIRDLDGYLAGTNRSVIYYDILAFHSRHDAMAHQFLETERSLRLKQSES